MKKTLVIFIFLVFILLIGISLKFGISIGKFKVASIEETIKSYNDLQNEIDKANDETRDYQELVTKINANEKLISTVKQDFTDISKNFEITVTGPYLGIANFIYNIENNFKVSNFNMKKDEAKFQIRNVKILEDK